MTSTTSTVTTTNPTQSVGSQLEFGPQSEVSPAWRYATRLTAVLAVVSAVLLPVLPSLTDSSASRHQQLAQAAVDRVAAGGGMLWLDNEESSLAAAAE